MTALSIFDQINSDMLILERFQKELAPFSNSNLQGLMSNIEVFDRQSVPERVRPSQSVMVGNNDSLLAIFDSFKKLNIQHFVQVNRPDFIRDLIISCMILKKPDNFLTNPIPFFVNNFKGESNYEAQVRKQSFSLKSTTEKAELLSLLEKFVIEDSRTKNYFAQIVLLIDELVSNAIFNAPVDDAGAPKYKNSDRNAVIRLDKACRIFCAHDNARFIVGCEDLYGSLSCHHLIGLLYNAFRGEKAVTGGIGTGAGLGCKMMIHNSSGFYVCVKPGKKTSVFCEFPLNTPIRKIEEMAKNIHISYV